MRALDHTINCVPWVGLAGQGVRCCLLSRSAQSAAAESWLDEPRNESSATAQRKMALWECTRRGLQDAQVFLELRGGRRLAVSVELFQSRRGRLLHLALLHAGSVLPLLSLLLRLLLNLTAPGRMARPVTTKVVEHSTVAGTSRLDGFEVLRRTPTSG